MIGFRREQSLMPTCRRRVVFGALLAALACAAFGQGSAVDEIAKYRAALQEGNPAELWEARGEALWKQARGPKNASLERCDLGLGAASRSVTTAYCA